MRITGACIIVILANTIASLSTAASLRAPAAENTNSKGRKMENEMKFEDIKVGDYIKVTTTYKVHQLDGVDNSFRGVGKDGDYLWVYECNWDSIEVAENPNPIPDHAEKVYWFEGVYHYIAVKNPDGSWTDNDGDEYRSAGSLIEHIRDLRALDSLQVLAVLE